VFVVFVANLARPAAIEADALAVSLGLTPYETRLALAAGPPCVLLMTPSQARANDLLGIIRTRGHAGHVFDDEGFVPSSEMPKVDDFRFEPDGVRRATSDELLPYGDVFAILRAVHDTSPAIERQTVAQLGEGLVRTGDSFRVVSKNEDREHVAYFFRRSGEKPWLLRERRTSYVGLGPERSPIAFANFTRTLARVREASPMAVFDDRLARRRVAERAGAEGQRSAQEGMDLLAHLLAMTIASQGGSPYR
jgi:hypothetical protein